MLTCRCESSRRHSQHSVATAPPPPLEVVYEALARHLASMPGIAGIGFAQLQRQQRPQRRERPRRAWLVPPVEVPATSHILEFDGACSNNPGPSGAGALILAPAAVGGGVVWAGTTFLGSGTNNTAEYNGAIFGLRAAAQLADMTALHCRGDSALVARQAAGIWQLREPRLAPLLAGVRAEASSTGVQVTWEVRPREENWRADALAKEAVQRGRQGDAGSYGWWGSDAATRVGSIPHPGQSSTLPVLQPIRGDRPAPPTPAAGDHGLDGEGDGDFEVEAACDGATEFTRHQALTSRPIDVPAPPMIPAGWDALDHVGLDACMDSPFTHFDDIPDRFAEAWACAVADVLAMVRDAQGGADLARALKWFTAMHDIMLRLPPARRASGPECFGAALWSLGRWRHGDPGPVVASRPCN